MQFLATLISLLFTLTLSTTYALPASTNPGADALPTSEPETSVSASTSHSHSLSRRANEYPHKSSCPGGGVDKYNFLKCQCTSFVAWRINDRLGKKFHNKYKGQHFGNANTWDNAARRAGLKVNKTPKVNAVAVRNAKLGHVAWVTKVGDGGKKVTVEEYNWENVERYGKRTVGKGAFDYYIHF
jgi:surface antigen